MVEQDEILEVGEIDESSDYLSEKKGFRRLLRQILKAISDKSGFLVESKLKPISKITGIQ